MAEVELGQTVHLSDIKLPKGVESVALGHGEDHDLPVAAVNKPKAVEEISDEAPEAPDAPETDSDADSEEEASEA
jgi:large subunit ribosomal protein L25